MEASKTMVFGLLPTMLKLISLGSNQVKTLTNQSWVETECTFKLMKETLILSIQDTSLEIIIDWTEKKEKKHTFNQNMLWEKIPTDLTGKPLFIYRNTTKIFYILAEINYTGL